jgi:hypothetical protein
VRPNGEIVGSHSGTDYYRIFTALSEVKYLAFQRDGSGPDYNGDRVKFDTVPDGDVTNPISFLASLLSYRWLLKFCCVFYFTWY